MIGHTFFVHDFKNIIPNRKYSVINRIGFYNFLLRNTVGSRWSDWDWRNRSFGLRKTYSK